MKFYTGIGSRQTPFAVLRIMQRTAKNMNTVGYTLRSGGAAGADSAFEKGAGNKKEIYLPWLGFNGNESTLLPTDEAFEMAAKYHPAWKNCDERARKFHARNCHQVLGHDLKTPSKLIICWTLAGKDGGGTGQALRIARAYNIPIDNLADFEVAKKYLRENTF